MDDVIPTPMTAAEVEMSPSTAQDSLSMSPTFPVPDGGRQAWLTVLGGALVAGSTFGYSSSFGVYQSFYVLEGGISSADASWIGSVQLFLLFLMGLPAGKLLDTGHFHQTYIVGALLYCFSMFMLSLASPRQYYQLMLSQGVGMGIGSGLLLVPALSIQGHYWRRHRSLAMGLVVTGSSCCGIIYPIMLNTLIRMKGFGWAVRASAFLTLGLLVIAGSIMRTHLPRVKDLPPSPRPTVGLIIRDWAYVATLVGGFLMIWGLFFPYFYLQLWSDVHGFNPTFSFYTLALLNGGGIFGRLSVNMVADRIGQFNVACPIALVSAALLFAMFGVTTVGATTVFALLYGFTSGSIISLFPSTLAVMARDASEMGIRLGIGYAVVSIAVLTGTPINGALLTNQNHWDRPIVFSGVVVIAGLLSYVLARHLYASDRGIPRWGKV